MAIDSIRVSAQGSRQKAAVRDQAGQLQADDAEVEEVTRNIVASDNSRVSRRNAPYAATTSRHAPPSHPRLRVLKALRAASMRFV